MEQYEGAVACRIAGIKKQRFNEAVAADRYICAPPVPKGGIRLFTKNDIIALFLYARLVEQRTPPSEAGQIACAVLAKLQEFPDAAQIKIPRRSEQGTRPPEQASSGPNLEGEEYSVFVEMIFDIAGIRAAIEPALQNETPRKRQPNKEI